MEQNRLEPGSESTHSGGYKPKQVAPPPPNTNTTPKGYSVTGEGVEGQNQKSHWGINLSPKMMILQGVGHLTSYIGVCYANNPPKAGYTAPAL